MCKLAPMLFLKFLLKTVLVERGEDHFILKSQKGKILKPSIYNITLDNILHTLKAIEHKTLTGNTSIQKNHS